jgi:hypothetical protein
MSKRQRRPTPGIIFHDDSSDDDDDRQHPTPQPPHTNYRTTTFDVDIAQNSVKTSTGYIATTSSPAKKLPLNRTSSGEPGLYDDPFLDLDQSYEHHPWMDPNYVHHLEDITTMKTRIRDPFVSSCCLLVVPYIPNRYLCRPTLFPFGRRHNDRRILQNLFVEKVVVVGMAHVAAVPLARVHIGVAIVLVVPYFVGNVSSACMVAIPSIVFKSVFYI